MWHIFFSISVLKTQNSPPLPLISSKRITEAFQDPWQLKYTVGIVDNYISFSQCAERMANGINESFAVALVKSLNNNMTFSQCCWRNISLNNSQSMKDDLRLQLCVCDFSSLIYCFLCRPINFNHLHQLLFSLIGNPPNREEKYYDLKVKSDTMNTTSNWNFHKAKKLFPSLLFS